jgi:hypothetical protein
VWRDWTRRSARLARIAGPAAALLLCCLPAGAEAAPPTYEVPLTPRPAAVGEHFDPIDMTRGSGGSRAPRISKAALAGTWCGNPTGADRSEPSLGPLPTVKVIFAQPSDKQHFDTFKNFVQGEVRAAADRVAAVSGATKTIRFDLGTDCPANPLDYVDIQVITLDKTSAQLQAEPIDVRRDTIVEDIKGKLGPQQGVKNFAVFAHASRPAGGAEGVAGIAQTPVDDIADPGNFANAGGRFALVFGTAATTSDPFFSPLQEYPAEFFLHEVAHTLGAVQDSAPHSTGAGHCFDEHDVMCYADGGPKNALETLCGSPFSPANETFDCGLDDYLNPAPASGSYLATHWNLQSSQFMCPLARCQTKGTPPSASISMPFHGHARTPFTVTAFRSSDDDGNAAFDWDLDGNGTYEVATGRSPNVSAEFSNEGFPPNAVVRHTVGVAVTDTDGAITKQRANVDVFPPITIVASVSDAQPRVGKEVVFDASQTSDPAGGPLLFFWDFDGDGSTDSSEAAFAHTYTAPGSYTARLTVVDYGTIRSGVPGGDPLYATVAIKVTEPSGPASVRKLKLKPTAFAAEKSGPSVLSLAAAKGTVVTATMNKSSTVKFTVERQTRVRGKTVYRPLAGSFSRKLKYGANSFRFTGRFNKRSLATGSYRLVALPTTKKSKPTRTAFRIVR